MEGLFLSRDELIQLTGYRQRQRQVDWLRSRGFTVDRNAAGAVLVLRDHVRQVMGGPGDAPERAEEPDLSALEGGK